MTARDGSTEREIACYNLGHLNAMHIVRRAGDGRNSEHVGCFQQFKGHARSGTLPNRRLRVFCCATEQVRDASDKALAGHAEHTTGTVVSTWGHPGRPRLSGRTGDGWRLMSGNGNPMDGLTGVSEPRPRRSSARPPRMVRANHVISRRHIGGRRCCRFDRAPRSAWRAEN